MRLLSTLFYLILVVLIGWFAARNWIPVGISLWGDWLVTLPLPLLLIAVVLLFVLPMMALHAVSRWTWRRKLVKAEKQRAGEAEQAQALRLDIERLRGERDAGSRAAATRADAPPPPAAPRSGENI